jgi:hypothetical protein
MCAGPRPFDEVEAFEDVRQVFLRDANPRVADRQLNGFPGLAESNPDLAVESELERFDA